MSYLQAYFREIGIATLDVSVLAAFWYAGEIADAHMPAVATGLLERGLYSPHLGFIAGILNPKIAHADIDEDLNRAFRELGVDAPLALHKARLMAAHHLATEVVDAHLDAATGASLITELFSWEEDSIAGPIIRIHDDLIMRIRRNSPEEETAKAHIIAACRDFLDANEKSETIV